jgi:outer membrane beta-barrel protein
LRLEETPRMRATAHARACARIVAACLTLIAGAPAHADAEARFESYEIRVVRPRYFVKTHRLELGLGLGTVLNQTFVYSVLPTALVTYHFSETWALEAQGAYGTSFDREAKQKLWDDFSIRAIVLRPESLANGRVLWTPSYGKFHLTSARVVYFDTHVTLGAGVTGVRYHYDYCESSPPDRVVQAPTFVLGLGQRLFVSRDSSVRLGFELQRASLDAADAACPETTPAHRAAASDDLFGFAAWSLYL